MYEVIVEPPAERFIKQLGKEGRKKLLDGIGELSGNPRLGKELVGRLSGLRSLRIGVYRAIYKIEEMKLLVFVLRVSHRKEIYSKGVGK